MKAAAVGLSVSVGDVPQAATLCNRLWSFVETRSRSASL